MKPQQLQFIYLTTLHSVQNFYQKDPSALIPFLHPDITWIRSRDNQFLTGKAAVTASLSAFLLPRTIGPLSLSCRVLYYDHASCTLLCTCNAEHASKHYVTFVWKLEHDSPKIIHIHGSVSVDEVSAPVENKSHIMPNPEPNLVFTGQRAERYYLNPHDILYAEADNISSRLICENRILHICQPLSTVQELLPDYFLKIHRSFLVNVNYITALRRYTVELQGSITLPVPEKKYKWLREYLDQYRGRPGL